MDRKICDVLTSCFIMAGFLRYVAGNGRMLVPPQRSSLWRDPAFFRFRYVYRNYNDHTLNCGGFWRMHQNNGKCGVCGDPWDAEQPRPNEAGGIYARGIIGRTYSMDKRFIDTVIQVTSSISGYFEFNICPNDDVTKRVSRECLDNFPMRVLSKDRSTSYGRRYIPDISAGQPGVVELSLEIPDGLECTQCVLQWRWHGANNYGVCRNGRWGKGCGEQPEMYNCADIAILPDDKIDDEDREQTKPYIRRPRPIIPSPTTRVPTPTSTQATTKLSSTARPTELTSTFTTTVKASQPTKPTTSDQTAKEQTTPIQTTTTRQTSTTRSTTTTRPTTTSATTTRPKSTSSTTTRPTSTSTTTKPTTTTLIPTTIRIRTTTTTTNTPSTTTSTTTTVLPTTSSYSQPTKISSTETARPTELAPNNPTTMKESQQTEPTTSTTPSPPPTTMFPMTDYVDFTSPTTSSTTQYVPTTPSTTEDNWTPTTERKTTNDVQSSTTPSQVTQTPNITVDGKIEYTTPAGSTHNVDVTGTTDSHSRATVNNTSDATILTDSTSRRPVSEFVETTQGVADEIPEHSGLLHPTTTVLVTETSSNNDKSTTNTPKTDGNVGTTIVFKESNVNVDIIVPDNTTLPDLNTTNQQTIQSSTESQNVRLEATSMSYITPEIVIDESKVVIPSVIYEQTTETTTAPQSNTTPIISTNNAFSMSTLEPVTQDSIETIGPVPVSIKTDVPVTDTGVDNASFSNMNTNTFSPITARVPTDRVTKQPANKTGRLTNVTSSTQGFGKDILSTSNVSFSTSKVTPSSVTNEATIRTTTQVVPDMISEGNTIIVLDPQGALETNRDTIKDRFNTSAIHNSISALTSNQNISATDSDLLVGLLNEILNIQNRSTTINVQPITQSPIVSLTNDSLPTMMGVNSSFGKRARDVIPTIVLPVEQPLEINNATTTPTVTPIALQSSDFGPSSQSVASNSTFGKWGMTVVSPAEQPQEMASVTTTPTVPTVPSRSVTFRPSTTNTTFGKVNMDVMPPVVVPVDQPQEVNIATTPTTTTTHSVVPISSNSSNVGSSDRKDTLNNTLSSSNVGSSARKDTLNTTLRKSDTDLMPPIVLPVEPPQEVKLAVIKTTPTAPPVSSPSPTSSDFGPSAQIVTSRSITFTGSAGGRLGGGRRRASLFPISRLVDINFNIENGEANREKRMQV